METQSVCHFCPPDCASCKGCHSGLQTLLQTITETFTSTPGCGSAWADRCSGSSSVSQVKAVTLPCRAGHMGRSSHGGTGRCALRQESTPLVWQRHLRGCRTACLSCSGERLVNVHMLGLEVRGSTGVWGGGGGTFDDVGGGGRAIWRAMVIDPQGRRQGRRPHPNWDALVGPVHALVQRRHGSHQRRLLAQRRVPAAHHACRISSLVQMIGPNACPFGNCSSQWQWQWQLPWQEKKPVRKNTRCKTQESGDEEHPYMHVCACACAHTHLHVCLRTQKTRAVVSKPALMGGLGCRHGCSPGVMGSCAGAGARCATGDRMKM